MRTDGEELELVAEPGVLVNKARVAKGRKALYYNALQISTGSVTQ